MYHEAYVANQFLTNYNYVMDKRKCVKTLEEVDKFWEIVSEYHLSPNPEWLSPTTSSALPNFSYSLISFIIFLSLI